MGDPIPVPLKLRLCTVSTSVTTASHKLVKSSLSRHLNLLTFFIFHPHLCSSWSPLCRLISIENKHTHEKQDCLSVKGGPPANVCNVYLVTLEYAPVTQWLVDMQICHRYPEQCEHVPAYKKVRARTGQTHRHTDRRDRTHYHAALAGDNNNNYYCVSRWSRCPSPSNPSLLSLPHPLWSRRLVMRFKDPGMPHLIFGAFTVT